MYCTAVGRSGPRTKDSGITLGWVGGRQGPDLENYGVLDCLLVRARVPCRDVLHGFESRIDVLTCCVRFLR